MLPRRSRTSLDSALRSVTPTPRRLDAEAARVHVPTSASELPVIVEADGGAAPESWVLSHLEQLRSWLNDFGALLLRGFAVDTPEAFGAVADAVAGARIAYMNRSSPRTTVGDRVYTSTDYPSHLPIFPHNEHGYSPVFPLYVFFGCLQPATTGGATPVGSTRAVGARLSPALLRRFRAKHIMYLRNYHEGFGLSWRESFQTDDQAVVEAYCEARGIRCEWRPDGVLRTRRIGPAEITHPRTGERVWFNHGTFYHVSTLPAEIRDELLATFDEHELPNHTYYGDGSPIEADVLAELRAAYTSSLRRFEWQRSDVLVVDNVLAVHAREPFEGPRRVLVSMAEEVRVG